MAAGYLAIQVLSLRYGRQDDRSVQLHPRPGPWNRVTVMVLPTARLARWPPPDSLNNDGLAALDARWTLGDTI
jgi:hypothetical protein